jgi:ABC-type transport system substrate-binding protein
MIEQNSGLVIRHDTTLTADQILALQADNGGRQFDIVWWWTVTDTAALLQTAGQSTSPYMSGWFNWSPDLETADDQDPGAASSQFDELVSTANLSTEADARNDAFRQAEQLLLDNAVYVPLGHWVQRFVQKPWLQGTRQGAWSGRIPVRLDADVTVQGRP